MFYSALATFRAPSDNSGTGEMRREYIRATSSWRKKTPRYDCVLINTGPDKGVHGFEIARVFLFFAFWHQDKKYPSALIQWFSFVDSEPDDATGMYLVQPDTTDTGDPRLAIVHVDSIFRAVHLLPVYRDNKFISRDITMHTSLDTLKLFYVNKFVDYHAFEVLS